VFPLGRRRCNDVSRDDPWHRRREINAPDVPAGSPIVTKDGEGAAKEGKYFLPSTRIATAPASGQFGNTRPRPRLS
jgi:hypothetical protein